MGPLPRSRAVGSIRDGRLLGCGRVKNASKTRRTDVKARQTLVIRSSPVRRVPVSRDPRRRPQGRTVWSASGGASIGREIALSDTFLYRLVTVATPIGTVLFRKRGLSRFRSVPSDILAALREFVGTPILNESRIPRAVGNPLLDGECAAGRPTNELRVRRFARGPEKRGPIRIQDVAVPPVHP